ncbi:JDVT-CTERM system glutamic-type intramembrane protease [Hydrogenophaga sp.]|uniref:JDVT-CTERM system glutamic-type intramembrane protease MrtJ n=1 Tax=Hydrogenophaga sp. TaxID=1904254 RepID=UPI00261D83BD|nr:JDVT-CTERM system glutamic-type intramembrane protease [Hydrogenophaga sp.]MDM7951547.1 JDVT-CTERM system glutamic-type intramembrane protease [Hydrogenophaga sp.]
MTSPQPPDPSYPPSAPASPTLAEALGVTRPHPPLFTWPPDTHLALAMMAALPVWLALGLLLGPHLRAPPGAWAWVSLVLVQPLLEELVFRGLLQGQALVWLQRGGRPMRLGPLTLANALVTVAFVALHLRAQPLAWALAVAVPSLVFGHLRERFSSVWPAVGVHAFYNAGFGLTAWLVLA